MSDYIKRDDALNIDFKIIVRAFENRKTTATNAVQAYADAIAKIPSEDVRPVVRGKWIVRYNPRTGWYRVNCSECGEDVTSVIPVIGFFPNAKPSWDFCHNCGADMREVKI